MKVLGEMEFRYYLKSARQYDELVETHRLILYRAYCDISPVLTYNDTIQGVMRLQYVTVEDHVQYLLDLRKKLLDERRTLYFKKDAFLKGMEKLSERERAFIESNLNDALVSAGVIRDSTFTKLKLAIEQALNERK